MDWNTFAEKWLKNFLPNLTAEEYDSCFLNEFLWHAFSYELIDPMTYLEGAHARAAYEAADKEGALGIQWDYGLGEGHTIPLTEAYSAQKLDKMPEFLVVGRDFRWTYVSTHENGWCGPYFYERPLFPWEERAVFYQKLAETDSPEGSNPVV